MRKGSITVYLSLVLCVIMALIFVSLDSARYSCGRAMVALAADEGLFSLFGEYDRILYDKYGLLMIDGGYGQEQIKAGTLLKETSGVMEKVLSPGIFSGNLFRADIDRKSVTGYVLATDSDYEMLKEQIRALMTLKLGADVVSSLFGSYSEAAETLKLTEGADEGSSDAIRAEYEAQRAIAEQTAAAAAETNAAAGSGDMSGTETTAVSVPEDFVNPLNNISAIMKLGYMSFLVPDIGNISSMSVKKSSLLEKRKLSSGLGVMPPPNTGIADRLLFSKYIIDYFPNFLSDGNNQGLRYQAEFAIAGKYKDIDNLRSVLNRLLVIREGLNYAYLLCDTEKQASIEALALMICSFLLIPEFTEPVKHLILLGWAYCESLMDVKSLLGGGKVPIFKDASTWKTTLSGLSSLTVNTPAPDSGTGFSYEEYLCILLMMKTSTALAERIADLLEYNRRIIGNENGFSLDTCICSLEIKLDGHISGHDYSLIRRYAYDTA